MVRPSHTRVLIVDDDPAVGRAMARMFAAEARVDVATSGGEALERFKRGESFGLVVCDVMMPGMTGTQLHELVKGIDKRSAAAFVFVTGGASREERARVDATGLPCIAKPLDMDVVRQLLKGCEPPLC
jgi:CheY-like chemotaxis protein